jgi:hypothetical protein
LLGYGQLLTKHGVSLVQPLLVQLLDRLLDVGAVAAQLRQLLQRQAPQGFHGRLRLDAVVQRRAQQAVEVLHQRRIGRRGGHYCGCCCWCCGCCC